MESIRDKQIAALIRMLHLNQAPRAVSDSLVDSRSDSVLDSSSEPIWKVLVFDWACRDIISTVLKVNDLRENGITVHMLLESERSPIPDVPAIYFMEPTEENVGYFIRDITRDLYDLYYANFSSSIPRVLMEELSVATVGSNTSHQVAQVYDQYINFLCPEENMFSLNIDSAFTDVHDPASTGESIKRLVDTISSRLFSVLVTMKKVPYIRAARGGAAEMVAQALDIRLREHLSNTRNNLFTDDDDNVLHEQRRPVMILLDRDFDLGTMVLHSWTYQALIHDIFDIKLNQVDFVQKEGGRVQRKTMDLDSKEEFWNENAALPFPEVAVNIDETSNEFKRKADEITRLSGVSSLGDIQSLEPGATTQQLQKAITSLPELTARKKTIDMHMNIATALLNEIKQRQLDVLFQLEENLSRQAKAKIIEVISDPSKTNCYDKLRLAILYTLAYPDQKGDIQEIEEALKKTEVSTDALAYIKKVRRLSKMSTTSTKTSPTPNTAGGDILGKFSLFGSQLSKLSESSSLSSLVSGVRNLLPNRKDLPITSVTKLVMEGSSGVSSVWSAAQSKFSGGGSGSVGAGDGSGSTMGRLGAEIITTEDLLYFDPRDTRRSNLSNPTASSAGASSWAARAQRQTSYQEAIVFVVGGGNYLEYQNLMDLSQRLTANHKVRTSITYGSTNIVNPESFVKKFEQLQRLG